MSFKELKRRAGNLTNENISSSRKIEDAFDDLRYAGKVIFRFLGELKGYRTLVDHEEVLGNYENKLVLRFMYDNNLDILEYKMQISDVKGLAEDSGDYVVNIRKTNGVNSLIEFYNSNFSERTAKAIVEKFKKKARSL